MIPSSMRLTPAATFGSDDDPHSLTLSPRSRSKKFSFTSSHRGCWGGKADLRAAGLAVALFFAIGTAFIYAFSSQQTEVAVLQEDLREARQALMELKKYAMQQPWQDFGKCTAELTAAQQSLTELEERLADFGIPRTSNSSDGEVRATNCRICPECPRAPAKAECPPTLPCPGFDLPAAAPDPGASGDLQLREKIRAEIVASLNVTEEAQRLQKELDEARQNNELLTRQLDGVLGAQPVAPGTASGCTASRNDVAKYLDYPVYGDCPDDWPLVQKLLFEHGCMQLPRRRCLARTPPGAVEPRLRQSALFDQRALDSRNVRWTHHDCDSFKCLLERKEGYCRQCFNMTLEKNQRWVARFRGSPTIAEVVKMKKGTLRIGLDIGGRVGTFAAKMAEYNITILTTGVNGAGGGGKALPYMETIALRGLIGIHLPIPARLPFYDNTLDVIHTFDALRYPTLFAFEALIYEWDRLLRSGGVLWIDLFYAPKDDMTAYVAALDRLAYERLYWNIMPKPEPAERPGEHVYLNCILEKPVRT